MGLSQTERKCPQQYIPGAGGAAAEGAVEGGGAHAQPTEQTRSGTARQRRRPDRAVYVPRARRSAENGSSSLTSPPESRKCHANRSPGSSTLTDEQVSPTEGKSHPSTPRKSLDRSYSNIYTPPHLRKSRCSGDFQPPPVFSDEVPSHGPRQVPNSDSAISFSDTSFNGYSTIVNHSDNGLDTSDQLAWGPEYRCESDRYESENNENSLFETQSNQIPYTTDTNYYNFGANLESSLGYNERNSNFYSNCANELVTNELSEINMFVPDPNETLEIIDTDTLSSTYNMSKDEDPEQVELRRASQEINRSNRRIIKQTFDSDVLVISEPEPQRRAEEIPKSETLAEVPEVSKPKLEAKVSLKREENDWESVFDDDGECLDPTLLEELTATVGKVQISKPKNNYDAYIDKSYTALSGEAFGHVIEVYGFPSEFKTNDLLSLFSEYKDTGFEIKWVDDTHALIVFSSAKIAAEVMSNPHPMIRCRPLRDATPESRSKAKRCAEFLQPYRQRPETCTALARRLVSGALGVKLSTARQERAEERRLIGIAREKKRLAAQHREAAWDGSLADNQHIDNT